MEHPFLMFLDHTQDAPQSVGLLWTSDQLKISPQSGGLLWTSDQLVAETST